MDFVVLNIRCQGPSIEPPFRGWWDWLPATTIKIESFWNMQLAAAMVSHGDMSCVSRSADETRRCLQEARLMLKLEKRAIEKRAIDALRLWKLAMTTYTQHRHLSRDTGAHAVRGKQVVPSK